MLDQGRPQAEETVRFLASEKRADGAFIYAKDSTSKGGLAKRNPLEFVPIASRQQINVPPPISSFLRGLEFLKCLLDVGDERRSSDLYNAPIGVDAVAERALEDAVTDNEEHLEVQEIGLGWNGAESN